MRFLLFSFFLITTLSIHVKAQDTLVFINGNKKIVKVDEVNVEQIKFHKYENLDGPTYTVSTSEIKFIKYPNGTQDVFVSESKNEVVNDDFIKPSNYVYSNKVAEKDSLIFRTTNIVYTNLVDLFCLMPSFTYERINNKGNFSLYIPVSIGIDPYNRVDGNYFIYNAKKVFAVGIGGKYYFEKQKKFNFFVAPLFESGTVVFKKRIASQSYRKTQAPLFIGSLNFGSLFTFKSGFIVQISGGLGVRSQKTKPQYSYYSRGYDYTYLFSPAIKLGFSVGYRF